MLPILILWATTYLAGLWRKKWVLRVAIALPILALVFYKYTHFFTRSIIALINPALGAHVDSLASAHLPATPPLGVSFFVFEFVHYLYDVSKGQAERDPIG